MAEIMAYSNRCNCCCAYSMCAVNNGYNPRKSDQCLCNNDKGCVRNCKKSMESSSQPCYAPLCFFGGYTCIQNAFFGISVRKDRFL